MPNKAKICEANLEFRILYLQIVVVAMVRQAYCSNLKFEI